MSTRKRRYPSDLSDQEWAVMEPLLPPPRAGGPNGGRPPTPRREVVDAITYLVRTGCSWRQLPSDFPPWRTVYEYFAAWKADGTLTRLHDTLRDHVRAADGRPLEPSAAIIDAQTVRGADTVGADTRGYDAAKKTNGRKRHIVVDTIGLLLVVMITAASTQDRTGSQPITERVLGAHPGVRLMWADGGYSGRLVTWGKQVAGLLIDIVRKRAGQHTFQVLPRRWVVERTFAWIMQCRRLTADYERTTAHAEAMVQWAMVGLMVRRLARHAPHHSVTPYHWS